jgi:exopolysaccharide biosynthesis protein
MKMKMEGSIYQSNGAGMGLNVQDGRLVNSRPDGVTGIQQIAMARKAMRYEKKVNMYAEGAARGERIAEMNEMMNGLKNC